MSRDTSLAKVFGIITRIFEDADITLDYRALCSAFDPFAKGASHNRLTKLSEGIKSFVRDHADTFIGGIVRADVGLCEKQVPFSPPDDGRGWTSSTKCRAGCWLSCPGSAH